MNIQNHWPDWRECINMNIQNTDHQLKALEAYGPNKAGQQKLELQNQRTILVAAYWILNELMEPKSG